MKKEYILRGAFIIVTLFILLGVLLALSPAASSAESVYIEVVLEDNFQYIEPQSSEECLLRTQECDEYIHRLLEQIVDEATEIQAMTEINRVEEIKAQYLIDYENLLAEEAEAARWQKKYDEYPEATRVWLYMKNEFGWSDEVCAGIMGNIMMEIGGGTLDFSNWDANGSSGYGMIQWIGSRRRAIEEKYGEFPTIEQQLEFMKDELFGTNGVHQQVSLAQLDAIMNGETPSEIAYNFAVYFERCASYGYAPRRGFADIAYNYFTE